MRVCLRQFFSNWQIQIRVRAAHSFHNVNVKPNISPNTISPTTVAGPLPLAAQTLTMDKLETASMMLNVVTLLALFSPRPLRPQELPSSCVCLKHLRKLECDYLRAIFVWKCKIRLINSSYNYLQWWSVPNICNNGPPCQSGAFFFLLWRAPVLASCAPSVSVFCVLYSSSAGKLARRTCSTAANTCAGVRASWIDNAYSTAPRSTQCGCQGMVLMWFGLELVLW